MPRFGFKELFLSVTLIAIGMMLLRVAVWPPCQIDYQTQRLLRIACFVTSGAFFGAGVAAPFKRAGFGAALGPPLMVFGQLAWQYLQR